MGARALNASIAEGTPGAGLTRAWLGRGLVAGVAGTAVLSLCDLLEDAALGRRPVYAPAEIARRLRARLGRRSDARGARRLGRALRWIYGPALAVARLWLAPRARYLSSVPGFAAAVCAMEVIALPATRLTPPFRAWSRGERALLGLHTLTFSAAVALAERIRGDDGHDFAGASPGVRSFDTRARAGGRTPAEPRHTE